MRTWTNSVPRRLGYDAEAPLDMKRAGELSEGWHAELASLQRKLADDPEGLDLLGRLMGALMGESEHEALSSSVGSVARPTVPTMDEPPSFQGMPRTGGTMDAHTWPMKSAKSGMASDRQPGRLLRLETDRPAILAQLARGTLTREAKAATRLERQFPGFKRVRTV